MALGIENIQKSLPFVLEFHAQKREIFASRSQTAIKTSLCLWVPLFPCLLHGSKVVSITLLYSTRLFFAQRQSDILNALNPCCCVLLPKLSASLISNGDKISPYFVRKAQNFPEDAMSRSLLFARVHPFRTTGKFPGFWRQRKVLSLRGWRW